MTPALINLARELVALLGDATLDGLGGIRWEHIRPDGVLVDSVRGRRPHGGYLPDLTDDATGGVLLGMLPRGMLVYDHGDEDGWEIREPMAYGSRSVGEGSTLAEAAAQALVALGRRS